MSFCRRDTARNLLNKFGNDNAFLDAVSSEIELGRINGKLAQKIVVMYNKDVTRLMIKLEQSLNG